MILLLYHLSPLFLHEHIFVLNFSVTSEQFKSGLLIFYMLYYSYDFSFSDHFFRVFIFRIYRELTWHVYLINLFNESFYSLTQSIYLFIYICIYNLLAIPTGMWDFSYPTKNWTCAASVEAERPNHWISREIPNTWHVLNLLVYLIDLFLKKDICFSEFVGFCQTSTWISCRYTYVLSLLNLPPISLPKPPL